MSNNSLQSLDHNGKLMPQALDFEEAVLGAMLLERSAVVQAILVIQNSKAFYKESNQLIFSAIVDLYGESNPTDILSVTNKLKDKGELEIVGGAYYITTLTNRVASAANIDYHSKIIMEKFFKRELIRISMDNIIKAYDDTTDVFSISNDAITAFSESFNLISTDSHKTANELTREVVLEIEKKLKGTNNESVPSGIQAIDKVTGGWQNGDLIILGARPSMGKTSLATVMGTNAVERGYPVAIMSLETKGTKLMGRIISTETGIDSESINLDPTKLDMNNLMHRMGGKDILYSDDLIIDQCFNISVMNLVSKVKKINSHRVSRGKTPIKELIIDYLQLLSADGNGNREQEISKISRTLKSVALELNIPVIALSQLSREVEKRPSRRPQMSDLRESGSIEQDADVIAFLLRPEYYKIMEIDGVSTKEKAILIFAKHRNGQVGDVEMRFISSQTKFEDWSIKEDLELFEKVVPKVGSIDFENLDEPF